MNLHICTISSRNDFLEKIYASIPNVKDIVWHIARENYNPIILNNEILKDSRIKIYELDCSKTDTSYKMNYIFAQIMKTDSNSYFCILDDDTLFHNNMYNLYNKYKNKDVKFMVVGKQIDKNNITRLYGTLPHECAIDSGNVLCHSHVLGVEKWPDNHWTDKYHVDFEFWNTCYKHFDIKKTDISLEVISIYNYFNDKPDTLDYIRIKKDKNAK